MLSFAQCPFVSPIILKLSSVQEQIGSKKTTNKETLHLKLPPEEPPLLFDSRAAVHLLNSCTSARNLKLGLCIHAHVLKSGLHSNVFVSNSLLDFYAKCGRLEDASKLFDWMPERTVVSWTSMMMGYCQNETVDEIISIFRQMLLENILPNEFTFAVLLQACGKNRNFDLTEMVHGNLVANGFLEHQFLHNCLIDTYSKCGFLMGVEKLMNNSSCRDVISWTSAISGCISNGLIERAFVLFFRMLEDGIVPNQITIISMIQACSLSEEWRLFMWIHGYIIKSDLCRDTLVMNSLVEIYSRNGYFLEGMKIFGKFYFTGDCRYLNPETMANLLQGCGHLECLRQGKQIHGYLIKHRFFPSVVVENSLMDMYAENKQTESAFRIFTEMNKRDVISWNTMIACFVKNGLPSEALELFHEVHANGGDTIKGPDFVTVLTALQACSELASLQLGQIIHGYLIRSGFLYDVFIQNSLIDMYGKSGHAKFAEQIFKDMPTKDLGSWNSMIAAYGINGNGTSALQTFSNLKELSAHQPNAISFLHVLSACGHSGLVNEAFQYFNSMDKEYGIQPSTEHLTCMVDMLGRLGRLDEAVDFIQRTPLRPGPSVWGALLGACALFGNVTVAERTVENLSALEPESKVWRVALSNVYAGIGRWEDAAKVRRLEMDGRDGVRKKAGWSSVEVRGESHRFMVGDTRHPDSKNIYEMLDVIKRQLESV
ncbi:PREDICTED: pentatricopeptide repeat-containing protein At1g03540-like [Nelumbo nucifera]|uniref:Uncharacterized protein n=2 Tax=Nelumbo nucifera TaxID=4432 RepID=A0A822ZV72_NELNU|nr:PREDICTED: pentatricopeptide repeat-containing protein At1g03540-like [Nelumbo nucifera]DAD47245.1 TPA_asm: hypothetical protein HUJ06_017182 [Nelumbo nucifera]